MRWVVPSAQVGGGGTLHVAVAHGSPAQAVPEHPNVHALVAPGAQTPAPEHVPAAVAAPLVQLAGGQGTTIIAYSHVAVPPTALQVPLEAYARRVVPSAQVGDGGALHVTLAHGSPAQAVPEHPKEHALVAPAAQTPGPEHVPAAVAAPFVHEAAPHPERAGAYSHTPDTHVPTDS